MLSHQVYFSVKCRHIEGARKSWTKRRILIVIVHRITALIQETCHVAVPLDSAEKDTHYQPHYQPHYFKLAHDMPKKRLEIGLRFGNPCEHIVGNWALATPRTTAGILLERFFPLFDKAPMPMRRHIWVAPHAVLIVKVIFLEHDTA